MSGAFAGSLQQYWAKLQSTYDTIEAWAATDAFDAIEAPNTPELNYEELMSHVGTMSLQGEVEGKRGGTWSTQTYIKPAAAGTAPDVGELLKHAIGGEAVVGGTSVTYSCADTTPSGIQLLRYAGANFADQISGAWIEQLEIAFEGGGIPTFSMSGGFADHAHALGGATCNGAQASSDTSIELQTGEGRKFKPGMYLKFGSDDNSGAGYKVTAVSGDTLTITPGLAVGASDTDAVAPVVPSQTLAGSALGAIACGLDIDSVSVGLISATVTMETGVKGLDAEATANRSNRLIRTSRRIAGSLRFYFLDESNVFLGDAWNGTIVDVALRIGANTAGSRCKVNMPAVRLDVAEVDVPELDEATFEATFKARQNSTAADEFEVVFD